MIGPFSSLAAGRVEHVFYHPVPTNFGVVADVEIRGQRRGKIAGVQLIDVRSPSELNDFRDPDGDLGVGIGDAPALSAGTYVRFSYYPDAQHPGAESAPTIETVTVTLDDGRGTVTTSAPETMHVPGLGARRAPDWGPRATYLPTGQVVFDVSGGADRLTLTQPAHGTVVAVAGTDVPDHRVVYTPDEASRIDPWVHADEFDVRLDDGRGGMAATVPVVIAKRATVIGPQPLPYLGVDSFSGRISAPIGHVQGYAMVPSVFVAEGIDELAQGVSASSPTAYGSVIVQADGYFTYTRDPRWEMLPMEDLDDSFALVAHGADHQWAAVVVPVGGAALVRYPSIVDVLATIATARSA